MLDVLPLKHKHQEQIPWKSNNIQSEIANVREKAARRNSNPFLKSIQEFNEALTKLKNSYKDQQTK